MVYKDERVNRHFELKMWVCVSDDFNVDRLMKEIIKSASYEDCAKLKADEIPRRLQEILASRKFLLVLDDVWNEQRQKWVELKDVLLNGVKGSKIIVSTRSKRVAKLMGTVSPYLIQGLSLEDSLSLFKKCAFKDGEGKDFPNLIKIGEEIVKKCKGVPLAVRSLGSLLFAYTNEDEWLKIQRSDIWQLEQGKEDILSVLKLSYDYLPSHLKRCFVYLSLFRKDFIYDSDDVADYWIANGLLSNSNNGIEELEDVALRYMKDLWSRCFIEDFEEKNHLYYNFRMHDLMHDLAISVTKGEFTVIKSSNPVVEGSERHFSFIDFHSEHQEPPEVLVSQSKLARSIIVWRGCDHIGESIINTCLPKFKHLHILYLGGINFEVLPNSIGALIHLRYLYLSYNNLLKKLPESICQLQKLEMFSFIHCSRLEKLPRKIQKMISLRHLGITTEEAHLQENGIQYLSSLRCLLFVKCKNLVTLPKGMKGLTGLRVLYITYCPLTSLPYGIKDLKRLQQLYIQDCEQLNLKMEFQGEDEDGLRLGVQTFMIKNLPSLVDLPQLILQGSANTLQFIRIEGCPKLVQLPEWLQNLTSLQTLEIIRCQSLSCLPEGMQRLTALKQLNIERCPALSESCRLDESKIAHVPEVHLDE